MLVSGSRSTIDSSNSGRKSARRKKRKRKRRRRGVFLKPVVHHSGMSPVFI